MGYVYTHVIEMVEVVYLGIANRVLQVLEQPLFLLLRTSIEMQFSPYKYP